MNGDCVSSSTQWRGRLPSTWKGCDRQGCDRQGCERQGCECHFMAKSRQGIQIQITDLLLLALFQRRQAHCMGNSFFVTARHYTILANDVAFYSCLFTADTVHMLILRTNYSRVSLTTPRTSANCEVCSLNFSDISCQNRLLSCPS